MILTQIQTRWFAENGAKQKNSANPMEQRHINEIASKCQSN